MLKIGADEPLLFVGMSLQMPGVMKFSRIIDENEETTNTIDKR